MNERIFNVHWEGPYKWSRRRKHISSEHHVLYALYGALHIYGNNVLLYIGKTADAGRRFAEHHRWVDEEYDAMTFRVASIGEIANWDGWTSKIRYPSPSPDVIAAVEALLILGHQPAYNTANKETAPAAKGFTIFNTGSMGLLLPEVSHRYHHDDW